MKINNIQSYFPPKTAQSEKAIGTNQLDKNTINNLRKLQWSEFSFESMTYAKKEISDQGKSFELFSVTKIDFSLIEFELNGPEQATEESQNLELEDFENGMWGVAQTSDRIANFVINGGGDDLNRLRQGRQGILQGLKEAEEMWGGQLPEISYKTMEAAVEKIDARIRELGESVIDVAA